ncbi:MAG: discoidin domain-containing protein [Akkermansiaceae bacterium]
MTKAHTLNRWSSGILAGLISLTPGLADPLLAPGDFIIPIDEDIASNSSYPGAEGPANILDGNVTTKYLNFGRLNTGFIVTPTGGATAIGSMTLFTANDAEDRDPTSYEIYGTNDAIMSSDNSAGLEESWTLLDEGELSLPLDRQVTSGVIELGIAEAYTSYKVLFPTVRGTGNSMQIADVNFFESLDGSGTSFLDPGSLILAIQEPAAESNSPLGEEVENLLDGDTFTKYLNFGRENSGFIVTPAAGPSVVRSFVISTANDFEGRDPVDWQLYGTNEPVTTEAHDTGLGKEGWTLIDSGTLALPAGRFTEGPQVDVNNNTVYTSYKWICRTVKGPVSATVDSMQISEFQFDADSTPGVLETEITDITLVSDGTQIRLDWTGPAGFLYRLEYSGDLMTWPLELENDMDLETDSPYIFPVTWLPEGTDKAFFRIIPNEP